MISYFLMIELHVEVDWLLQFIVVVLNGGILTFFTPGTLPAYRVDYLFLWKINACPDKFLLHLILVYWLWHDLVVVTPTKNLHSIIEATTYNIKRLLSHGHRKNAIIQFYDDFVIVVIQCSQCYSFECECNGTVMSFYWWMIKKKKVLFCVGC